ncbi:hypothetical protein DNU06_04900 [Putridiphycobacter roseus]|uniref:Secretion system C-terminal sorting domain-containing protein n=1 Tax=Putridiphycobacter roseus TaxID=2219161 RepID=A0A2W1N0A5_9FLAO|nr:endonuclease/exonuclease/phosphatase family protein [Putridiphycobacter roseus]PZE17959.1 hypothetical protein DNU06_04900 [Putridiphycobacter roseus]
MKTFILALIVFPYVILGQQQHLNQLSFGTDSTLDVMTWNMEWFPKYGQTTADSVLVILKALDIDIIACQEIDDSVTFKNMVNQLSTYQTFIQSSYFPGLALIYNTSTISINSAYEIYSSFPYWSAFPRAPQVLEFTYKNQNFAIINNHLKCCGDGYLNNNDDSDEENRRFQANTLLENYIATNFTNTNVILLGDLNDEITDLPADNVFLPFLNQPTQYLFADDFIANSVPSNWSYPAWPSHIDHILITKPLFNDFSANGSSIETIRIDDYLNNGFSSYDAILSDHRPVALKLNIQATYLNTVQEEKAIPAYSIYPNPADALLNIEAAFKNSQARVTIMNLTGKICAVQNINDFHSIINTSNIVNGTYLLIIQNELEIKTFSINIQHE